MSKFWKQYMKSEKASYERQMAEGTDMNPITIDDNQNFNLVLTKKCKVKSIFMPDVKLPDGTTTDISMGVGMLFRMNLAREQLACEIENIKTGNYTK